MKVMDKIREVITLTYVVLTGKQLEYRVQFSPFSWEKALSTEVILNSEENKTVVGI